MITYRVQQAQHPTEWLLDPERQLSTSYCRLDENGDPSIRAGVSACESIETLACYLAQVGIPWNPHTSRLVAMECEWADDEDEDADLGAVLVIPTTIISDTLIADCDEFWAAMDAALAEAA